MLAYIKRKHATAAAARSVAASVRAARAGAQHAPLGGGGKSDELEGIVDLVREGVEDAQPEHRRYHPKELVCRHEAPARGVEPTIYK